MKKSFVLILVFSLLLQLVGCYSPKYITKDEFINSDKGDIKIVTQDNQSYLLKEGWYSVNNDTIFIESKSKFNINPYGVSHISLKVVKEFEKKEYNSANTIIMVTFSAIVIAGLIQFYSYLVNLKHS